MASASRWLPRGNTLPIPVWQARHRGILILLVAHVPTVFLFALVRGESVLHGAVESALVGSWAVGALICRRSRATATVAASLGLLTASAVLVHLSGGVIELHFHYFVMVGVVTLYQEWRPFLIAIGYVVFQHGLAGAISPESVYNHESAVAHPWLWAGIHGVFILGMSVAGIVSWKLSETLLAATVRRESSLAEAQSVGRLGSWELDRTTGVAEWSDEMYRVLGVLPGEVQPGPDAFLACVHPDDLDVIRSGIASIVAGRHEFTTDFRVLPADGGPVRWLHGRWRASSIDGANVTAIAGTLQDVSDRVRADGELRTALSLLEATLDATADGILVVDTHGTIVSFNRRFSEMWRIPRSILDAGDDNAALAWVIREVADPDVFLGKVRELYAQPEAESSDTIEFRDGRIFERHSRPQRVDDRVVGRVWTFRDITAERRLQEELAHQAFHDALTNLANQALFRDRVDHALTRAHRRPAELAVMFIDLDNFKTVNDSLGHTAGDELLVRVTERLLACVRDEDTVARLGGDEFAVLVEDIDGPDDAIAVAERVSAAFDHSIRVGDQEIFVSASLGIAFADHGSRQPIGSDQLLRNADLAMYTAKRRGKGRFETYEPTMHEAAVERLAVEADLRNAVARNELVVHYQPMVDIGTGFVRVVEALVRWDHPTRGLVPPMSFIPLAEETGIIDKIGLFVLHQACTDTARLRQDSPGIAVSVNVSPRQLRTPSIVSDVVNVLAVSGLPADALILEITEGAMMHDPEGVAETLKALHDIGVRLAVDDFGTGYSSLSYLQRFPIDIVKIDRSFVDKVDSDPDSLVPTIVRMAQSLRLTAVAEGVESGGQLDRLRDLGCDLAQGFHLARPQPLDQVLALLRPVGASAASDVSGRRVRTSCTQ